MISKIICLILCSLVVSVACLFEMCNHNVIMKTGEKLYVNSPYYPAKYPIGTSCRYMIKAPQDHQLKFSCNIELIASSSATSCENEVFIFNPEGSEVLTESEYFCGSGKMERKSFLNQAVISYISTPYYKRMVIDFINESEEDTLENKMEKTEIKIKKRLQEIQATTNATTTSKALKENQFATSLIATTSAPIAALNNLSTSFTQSFSSTISSPTSSALGKEDVKLQDNVSANKKVSNSFAYVVTLLSNKIGKEALVTTTSATTKSSLSIPTSVLNFNEHFPIKSWRNGSIVTHKASIERVAGQDYKSSQQSTAAFNSTPKFVFPHNIRSNEAGGSFSCLVEVVEPQCECGWSSTVKIAGATGVAGINEFPSMAGIMTIKNHKIFCGATIIHHRYLLSAAHCYTTPETNTAEYLTAVMGEHDLSTVQESVYTRQYDLVKIILHEQFRATSNRVQNDIALLKTGFSIEWNRSVGPACLPFGTLQNGRETVPYAGQRVETAGWGTTSFGGQQSSLLLRTTLDVISRSTCQYLIGSIPFAVFCTYTPKRDTCQYDSGGALYAREERLYAVGIVSYGYACATKKPSINTKISSYLNWIRYHTPDVKYCSK